MRRVAGGGGWRLACLVKVYLVGGGNYARFLKFRSPVLIGVLEVFERVGGLTRYWRRVGLWFD